MAAASATVQAKKSLRAAISKIKKAIPEPQIALQSQQITAHLLGSPYFQQSQRVSCYLSIGGEVDTSSLVLSILRSGKKLYVPKLDSGLLHMVRLYGEEDYRTLRSGVWGIKEPAWEWENKRRESGKPTDEGCPGIDLMLMPGVAFDKGFSRIGYGKGYYDQFLSRYTAAKSGSTPLLVALALKEQLLEAGKIPVEDHDWKMNLIVTGEEVLSSDTPSNQPSTLDTQA
ncbi:5,10-methenyltetrahydrofolate synthetase [Tulasnella sp. 427]|nr:5,10-methenyltetrahydrofolate synthetase [Tulasnella sp. 427]